MKSSRTKPTNHAPEGDERIRTAVTAPSTDPLYEALGVGYSIATRRLFAPMGVLQRECERILGRPIMTHEFADRQTWVALCDALEVELAEHFNPVEISVRRDA